MKKSELKWLIKEVLRENMFPPGYDRKAPYKCGTTIFHATKFLLIKGKTNFKVISGIISIYPKKYKGYVNEMHYWIEFDNGRIFDPSKEQFKKTYDADLNRIRYKKTKEYEPDEFLEMWSDLLGII